jgi:hypothetical protein
MAAITAISRSGNVVTVTATAHGLSVGQAAWMQGVTDVSFNGINTVASASANSFTFAQTAANGSSSGGTATAAKQIIALNLAPTTTGEVDVMTAFWYPVTAGNEFPQSASASQFSRSVADENTAISTGRLIEEVNSFRFPSSYTGAQMEAFLQVMYTAKLAARNAVPSAGQFYGFFFDGTAWSRA